MPVEVFMIVLVEVAVDLFGGACRTVITVIRQFLVVDRCNLPQPFGGIATY
jgi:hypothetical protein